MAKEVTLKEGNSVEWKAVPQELQVTIVSPEETLFSDTVTSIIVPGEKGRFEILKNHAPIISCLVSGTIVCAGKAPYELTIKSGFVEVAHNVVSLCVEL